MPPARRTKSDTRASASSVASTVDFSGSLRCGTSRRCETERLRSMRHNRNTWKRTLFGVAGVGVVAIGALPILGQSQAEGTAPTFDAASVRPHQDTGTRNRTRSIEPGRITCLDITLRELILMA